MGSGAPMSDAPDNPPASELPLDLQRTQVSGVPEDDFQPAIAIEGYSDFQEIHRGGQGIVYRALQESTRRTVAIKVLREGAHADAAARKRFQREVEIVAHLEHRNIVAVFDSGVTTQQHPYFVMEYVRGMELDHYVRSQKLSLEETLELFCVVLEATHHAHDKHIVHRDLKPSNILVDEHGNPKLVDFGLARAAARGSDSVASMTGQVLGTVGYMSPEQVMAKPEDIGPRTDVYSLGVILYEITTGKSPYPAATQLVDILRHITETPPRRPSRSWESETGLGRRTQRPGRCPIDGELETILLKALAKEPERRYASAQAFADDIHRYLAGLPIAARRDSGLYVIRKKLKRNRGAVAAGIVLVLLTVLLMMSLRFIDGTNATTLDPETLARFEIAERDYLQVRDELSRELEARKTQAGPEFEAFSQQSLEITSQAIAELRAAVAKDPTNLGLRELLVKSYQREIDLLRRLCALEES